MSSEIIFHGPPSTYPPLEKSLGHFILKHLSINPDEVFQYDPYSNTSYTRGEIRTLTIRVALEFQRLGLKKDDILILVVKNHKNAVLPLLAAIYLGVIVNPLDEDFNKFELARMIELTKPKMLLLDAAVKQKFQTILNEAHLDVPIYLCDKDFEDNFMKPSELEDEFEPIEVDVYKTFAFIFCTSGTTGFIKGVTHTHNTFYRGRCNNLFTINKSDKILSTNTLAWEVQVSLVIFCIVQEATLVSLNWDTVTKEMLDTVENYEINYIITAPGELIRMIRYENFVQYTEALSKLRVIEVCGARCTEQQMMEVRKKIPKTHIVNPYGMVEVTMYLTYFDINTQYQTNITKINSNGLLCFGTSVKVIDVNTGKCLGKNEQGELIVKTDSLTLGYFNNPAVNANAFTEDGWFRSGDLGYFDDDECLFIVGRLKEIFKYDTFYVCPSEVEYVINKHPAVENSCVVGIPDEIYGDLPMAFVVKKENIDVTEDEIIKFVEKYVSYYERLRGGVRFIDELPRTPSGKIRRSDLQILPRYPE